MTDAELIREARDEVRLCVGLHITTRHLITRLADALSRAAGEIEAEKRAHAICMGFYNVVLPERDLARSQLARVTDERNQSIKNTAELHTRALSAEAEAAALRGAALLLVDLVWQAATDSEEVPSSIHAKRLIDLALASCPPALAARPDTAKEKDRG